MILCDLSHIAIASFMASADMRNSEIDEVFLKHTVFNALKSYKMKFAKYGELVICCDSRNYWRKDTFPQYKAHRKGDREKSSFDWETIFSCINQIKEALKEHFPYKVIEVDGAEADDVIAVIAKYIKQPHMIVTSDEDFLQLQRYDWVQQYSVKLKKIISTDSPLKCLQEKIIRGDSGDGIPNFKTQDDAFVIKKRQSSIYEKELVEWLGSDVSKICTTEELLKNYRRNENLIDFEKIPQFIIDKILETYKLVPNGNTKTVYDYFRNNKFFHLMMEAGDF